MDDANKVKQIVAASSKEQIAKSLRSVKSETDKYDFEKEFAATAKNKPVFVVLVTLATMLAFAAVAVIVTFGINKSTENLPVDIASFEDLNLKDLLDSAKRTEQQLETYVRELNDLENSRDNELEVVNQSLKTEIERINAERGLANSKNRKINAAKEQANQKIAEIQNKYAPLINEKKNQVSSTSKTMETYDSRRVEQARQSEEAIAAERVIFEKEKAELQEYYETKFASLNKENARELSRLEKAKNELVKTLEIAKQQEIAELILKYNPVFDENVEGEETLAALSKNDVQRDTFSNPIEENFESILGESIEKLNSIQAQLETIEVIDTKLQEIPYQNSIPGLLTSYKNSVVAVQKTYTSLVATCAQALFELQEKNKDLEAQIVELKQESKNKSIALNSTNFELYTYIEGVESLARQSGNSGYILNIDNDNVYIWLDSLSANAKEARVIRDDKSIATLKLSKKGSLYLATVTEKDEGVELMPFDSVLVTLKDSVE